MIFKKYIFPYYAKRFRSISTTFGAAYIDASLKHYHIEDGWHIPDDLSYSISDDMFGAALNFNFEDFPIQLDMAPDVFFNFGRGRYYSISYNFNTGQVSINIGFGMNLITYATRGVLPIGFYKPVNK